VKDDSVEANNRILNAMGMEGGQKVFVVLLHPAPFPNLLSAHAVRIISSTASVRAAVQRAGWPRLVLLRLTFTGPRTTAIGHALLRAPFTETGRSRKDPGPSIAAR
jgi:hypothetical protein